MGTLPEKRTAISPSKMPFATKRKPYRLPTIHFQMVFTRWLRFREGDPPRKVVSRKFQHTRRANMKGIPLWPVGKGLGVCSKGVVKQP